MNINTAVWGTEYREYDTVNARTGTMDFTDPDYVLFPPFTKNNLCEGGTNPSGGALSNGCLYMGMINRPEYFNMERDFDKTICYAACINSDLFITNYAAPMPAITDENTGAVTLPFKHMVNRTGVFSLALLDNYDYCEGKTSHTGNSSLIGTVHTPYYNQTSQIPKSFYEYVPNGINEGSYDTATHRNASNNNLFFSYWRDFGVRSLFCVIYVDYFDGTYNATTGQPLNVSDHKTLHWYESQTDSWKESHPILAAFGRPYIRKGTDGLYTKERRNNHIIIPDFSRFTIDYAPEHSYVWQPCVASSGTTPENCFPIFGGYRAGFAATSGANAVAQFDTQLSTGGLCKQSDIILGHGCRGVNENSGIASNSVGRRTFWLELDGTAENLEMIRKSMAGYGLFFADDEYNLAGSGRDDDRWTDENMCLGVIDSSGYTDGTYTRGAANEGANNFNWKTISQSQYNPDRPPPTPTMSYDDVTTFNDITNIATLTRRYALTKQNVEDLGSELWQISSDIINNIQNDEWYKYTADVMDTFLVTDPLSCIVSLQKYPLTIPDQSGPVNIKLGKAETSISANITKATAKTYYFTPVKIQPRFGNSFMDYEPYTHFELYVPFCGTTELDPRDILGRNLAVNLVVDFNTGTCVAYVLSDSLVIETINGSLAIDIPVTGVDSTTIASNISQGIINTRNARYTHQFGTLGKVASPSGIVSNIGNVWGSAQTILTSENNAKLSEYELTHQPAQPHVIGSASPVGSWAIDFKCRLLIYYPTGGIVDESKVADSSQPTAFDSTVYEQYQTQIGFATVDPVAALGASYAHTLVCAEKAILNNVTTPNGRPATEPELQLIRQALQEGVILP